MKPLTWTSRLALLGALPFVLCSLLLTLDIMNLPLLGSVPRLLSSYTLVIAVFMCGVHWGQYLQPASAHSLNLFIVSNVLTILLWIAWLLAPTDIFLFLALIVFVLLLLIDARLRLQQLIGKPYFRMRLLVTSIVCASLLLAVYAL